MAEKKTDKKKESFKVETFNIPFDLESNQENITINTNAPSKPSKEQLINQAFKFHSEGNVSEAVKYYQLFINQGFKDVRVFCNYGVILKDLGNLQDAELSYRKAIKLKPNFAEAHYNLGNVLRDLGNLQDAELSYRKAIEINPDYAEAHSNLGIILKDLGKLKESRLCSEKIMSLRSWSITGSYSFNYEMI